ncbi:MAG: hypothetical protein AAFP17_17900 [Pseudomonadota bacterium]
MNTREGKSTAVHTEKGRSVAPSKGGKRRPARRSAEEREAAVAALEAALPGAGREGEGQATVQRAWVKDDDVPGGKGPLRQIGVLRVRSAALDRVGPVRQMAADAYAETFQRARHAGLGSPLGRLGEEGGGSGGSAPVGAQHFAMDALDRLRAMNEAIGPERVLLTRSGAMISVQLLVVMVCVFDKTLAEVVESRDVYVKSERTKRLMQGLEAGLDRVAAVAGLASATSSGEPATVSTDETETRSEKNR